MKKKIEKVLVSILFISISMLMLNSCNRNDDEDDSSKTIPEGYYKNPIIVPQIRGREIADPSLYKYQNKYYLLSTQMYSNDGPGMLVWESSDMVNWSEARSIIITGSVEPMMAPELIYSEGSYYLYWSVFPGEKHYMAKYTPKPDDNDPFGDNAKYTLKTYDFLKVSDVNIDGEIFFDKNDIYMFYCGMGGVQYKELESLDIAGNAINKQLTECSVTGIPVGAGDPGSPGWTEAPVLFFEDGYYYLTYSGNHFQSPHYQIHSARGTSIETIKPYKSNPLIYKPDGLYNGFGNDNFIVGPDLKTKYMSYHVKIGEGIHTHEQGPINRQMMLDKYTTSEINGIETDAPNLDAQPIPSKIEWELDLNSKTINSEMELSAIEAKAEFVLEGNIMGKGNIDGKYGLSANNGKIKFAISKDGLEYYIEGIGWKNLGVTGVKFDVWHKLNIDKKGNKLKFYYDDRYVGETTTTISESGKFGYFTESTSADLAWIGISNY